jgi:hypothetical protein
MEKHTMTYAKNRMIALGLATVLATGATVPALAAAPIANAAALTSAAGNVIQVQDRGHGGRAARGYGYGYAYPNGYGYAYPDAYGYASPYSYGYA